MNRIDVLNNLQQRNNSLKSILLHEQIRYDNYPFEYFQKYSSMILEEYRKHGSFYKASLNVGIDYGVVINWYVQGKMDDPVFNKFSKSIDNLNGVLIEQDSSNDSNVETQEDSGDNHIDGDYMISQYGDGWSYKTFVDGEKIFIISNDLETLKDKVRNKHLPLD